MSVPLDFYTYEETLAAQATNPTPPARTLSEFEFQYITTSQELAQAIGPILGCTLLAIDTETTGLDPHQDKLRLVQVAARKHPCLVIDLWRVSDLTPLRTLLAGPARKVAHTLLFEWKWLQANGLPLAGPYFDTQLAYKVLKAGVRGKSTLATVMKALLGIDLDKSAQRSDWSLPNLSLTQIRYAAADVAALLEVVPALLKALRHRSTQWDASLLRIANLESACVPATGWMELNGLGIDHSRWHEAIQSLNTQKRQCLEAFHTALGESHAQQLNLLPGTDPSTGQGTNPGSAPQVMQALARQGVTLPATNQRAVIRVVHKHPALPHLLDWRRTAKLGDSIRGLPTHIHTKTGRLHPSFFQMGARSGRFSCRNPALQTIPHAPLIRRCFTAAPGYVLVKADYSQIELRIIAKITSDPLLREAYATNQDVHRMTASLLMGKPVAEITDADRRIGKSINFGLVYGMSAVRLQLETHLKYGIILTHKEASALHQRYFELFEGVDRWHKQTKRALYSKNQRQAKTLLGRVRTWTEQPSFNEFVNFPVQGTSADITKLALVKLIPYLDATRICLVMVNHDEILLEVLEAITPETTALLYACMVDTATPILSPVPVEVDIKVGESWGG